MAMASKGLGAKVVESSKERVETESESKEEVLRLKAQMDEIYQAWINGNPPPSFPTNYGENSNGKGLGDQFNTPRKEHGMPRECKTPQFDLYIGHGDPVTHVRGYCNEMRKIAEGNDLWMAYFSKSLTGAALEWYNRQDTGKWPAFGDIARDFVQHFQHDGIPNCSTIEKKSKGSFGDYWLKWNEQVVQSSHPIERKKVVSPQQQDPVGVFVKPVQPKLQLQPRGCPNSPLCYPSFPHDPRKQTSFPQYPIHSASPHTPRPQGPRTPALFYPNPQTYQPFARKNFQPRAEYKKERLLKKQNAFTLLVESYASLFEKMEHVGLIKPLFGYTPDQQAKNFDPTVRCKYHSNIQGHSIEDCRSLKREIEKMIRDGRIAVQSNETQETAPSPSYAHIDAHLGDMPTKVSNMTINEGPGNSNIQSSG